MKYFINTNGKDPMRDRVARKIVSAMAKKGHTNGPLDNKIKFVLNLTDLENPKPFHRRSYTIFVVSLAALKKTTQQT